MNCTGWDLILTGQNKEELADAGGLKVRQFENFEDDWNEQRIQLDDKNNMTA